MIGQKQFRLLTIVPTVQTDRSGSGMCQPSPTRVRCLLWPELSMRIFPSGMRPLSRIWRACSLVPMPLIETFRSGTCQLSPTWGGCSLLLIFLMRTFLSGTCRLSPIWLACFITRPRLSTYFAGLLGSTQKRSAKRTFFIARPGK